MPEKNKSGNKTMSAKEKIAQQEERIRELEEKLRRLEASAVDEEEPEGTAEGTAAGVLKELGGVFPGLDGLIQGLEKSDAFRERLRAIDEELASRLRGEPLKRVEGGVTWSSLQTSPPGRTAVRKPPSARQRSPMAPREEAVPKETPVDVFDEGNHLKVVAELPGIEEEDIEIDLNGARLVVSASTPAHKFRKDVALPYAPEGKVERLYRNGIMELTLWKE